MFISLCTFSVYPSQALCDVWVTSIDSHIQIICSPRCSMRHDVVPDECLHVTVRVHPTVREKLLKCGIIYPDHQRTFDKH